MRSLHGLLTGKVGLVIGVANEQSIAAGCAHAFRQAGAAWQNAGGRATCDRRREEGMTDSLIPSGFTAVMARRRDPPDTLDFYPTPPWATRALLKFALGSFDLRDQTAWDPAAGEGHMAEVLRESFRQVHASDVHDYGCGYQVGSYIGQGADKAEPPWAPDWVITNPPFNLALEFALRAIPEAKIGVALLLRTAWIEGEERYRRIFGQIPPTAVWQFAERVPMTKGAWDPAASTATAYAWFVWRHPVGAGTGLHWIPPGQREALTRPDDIGRFAVRRPASPAPLFEGEA